MVHSLDVNANVNIAARFGPHIGAHIKTQCQSLKPGRSLGDVVLYFTMKDKV